MHLFGLLDAVTRDTYSTCKKNVIGVSTIAKKHKTRIKTLPSAYLRFTITTTRNTKMVNHRGKLTAFVTSVRHTDLYISG